MMKTGKGRKHRIAIPQEEHERIHSYTSYKEDRNLPDWVLNPTCNKDERAFNEWYKKKFHCDPSPRSARYYQMRSAWMASKEYYKNETK